TFENAVVIEVIEDFCVKNEEAAVDPLLDDGFLLEFSYSHLFVEFDHPKVRSGMNGSKGCQATVSAMEFDQCRHIDVGESVPICHTEEFIIADICFNPFDTAAGVGFKSGVDKGYTPVFAATMIEEVSLYRISQVAEAEHKIIQPVMRIDFHQMPK